MAQILERTKFEGNLQQQHILDYTEAWRRLYYKLICGSRTICGSIHYYSYYYYDYIEIDK